jgi:arginyl-tRNA synthetase
VVFLEEILNSSQEEMHSHMKKQEAKYAQISDPVAVSDNIGLSAIVVQDMSAKRHKDYAFDW